MDGTQSTKKKKNNTKKVKKEITKKETNEVIQTVSIEESKTEPAKQKDTSISFINTLVLSGGSVKGIAHIGVLKYLEEAHILENIVTFAGTSVGSIVATLHIIGYTPDEIYEFVILLDLNALKKINIDGLLSEFGLNNGSRLVFILEKMFETKCIPKNITMKQLYEKTQKTLTITTVCANDKSLIYISHDSHPELSLITALRMSTAVPFFFIPVTYNNRVYIDGGVMNNYPINLFSDTLNNVIGVYLNEKYDDIYEISDIGIYISCVIESMFSGMARLLIDKYEKRTIKLDLPQLNMLNIAVNTDDKKKLFDIGYERAKEFILKIN